MEMEVHPTNTSHEGEKSGIFSVTEDFAENTTIHTIPHVFKTKNKFFKSSWIIITCFSLGILMWQVVEAVQKYYSYPTSTVQTINIAQLLEFPAVSICNQAKFKKSSVLNQTTEESGSIPTRIFLAEIKAFYNLSEKDQVDLLASNSSYYHKLTAMYLETPLEDSRELGFKPEDMLLSCNYGHELCDEKNFTSFTNFIYGNCYTFNAHTPKSSVKTVNRGGPGQGLVLKLMVQPQEYLSVAEVAQGIRLVVHNQTSMPFPDSDGIHLPVGFDTRVSIQRYDESEPGIPYSDCVTRRHLEATSIFKGKYPGLEYNRDTCVISRYQTCVINVCKCYDSKHPVPSDSDVPICSTITNPDFQDCSESCHQGYRNITCYPACYTTSYRSTVSQALWPASSRNAYEEEMVKHKIPALNEELTGATNEAKLSLIRENILRVTVYFVDTSYSLSETSPSYTVSDLLSTLGSQISLWLGMSVISGFEILEYIGNILIVLFKSNGKRN